MYFSTLSIITLYLTAASMANPMPHHKKVITGSKGSSKGAATSRTTVSAALKANITQQIKDWQNDIIQVNNFLDNTNAKGSSASISAAATKALGFAVNEGFSADVLNSGTKLDAAGAAAFTALQAQFGVIGPSIKATITDPENFAANAAAINKQRCPQAGNAIGNEFAVQQAAAAFVGITIKPPQTPTACNALAKRTNLARNS